MEKIYLPENAILCVTSKRREIVVAAEMFEKGFRESSMEDGLKEDEGGEQGQTAGGR